MSAVSRRLSLLVALAAACWFAGSALFSGHFLFADANSYGVWFLDSFAILASNDAVGRGLDPYLPNPLDYFHRPHVYSHWWLHLRDLGLTRAQNPGFGLAIVGTFFIAAVSRLRPRSGGEGVAYLGVLCSTPVLLAFNRANNDLVVFTLLAPVVPSLLSVHRPVRFVAVGLIAVAAGLKFYPAVAGLILLASVNVSGVEIRVRLLVAGLLLAAVAVSVGPDIVTIAALAPQPRGLLTFGAVNFPQALGFGGGAAPAFVWVVAAVVIVAFWRSRCFEGWVVAPADQNAWLSFCLGAALLAGCFFAGTNYAYRWVFALWLVPMLWRLPRDAAAPVAVRRLGRATAVLLVFALWADAAVSAGLRYFAGRIAPDTAMRWADRFFIGEQPVTWALFVCLLGFLTHFAREGLWALFRSRPAAVSPAR